MAASKKIYSHGHDLFGTPVVILQRVKAEVAKPVAAKPDPAIKKRWPTGRSLQLWEQFGFRPCQQETAQAQLVHFNAGAGYDLIRKRRSTFNKCFGYVLAVHESSGEVLVHLPKPLLSTQGENDFYICPFSDLLPLDCVPGFNGGAYRLKRPPLPCSIPPQWEVTAF